MGGFPKRPCGGGKAEVVGGKVKEGGVGVPAGLNGWEGAAGEGDEGLNVEGDAGDAGAAPKKPPGLILENPTGGLGG